MNQDRVELIQTVVVASVVILAGLLAFGLLVGAFVAIPALILYGLFGVSPGAMAAVILVLESTALLFLPAISKKGGRHVE